MHISDICRDWASVDFVIFDSVSLQPASWIPPEMGSTLCPWVHLDKVERIRHSIASNGFSVSWVPRFANSTADEMAWQGLNMTLDFVNTLF